jgi:glycosyltransferase involved in cell wall biosynthesis
MTAPRTAAFITDAPRVAGSEVWLLDVLPLLPAHGWQPTVFLPDRDTLDELARRFGAAGVPVERFGDPTTLPDRTRASHLRVLQAWEPATYRQLLPRLTSPRLAVLHDQLEYHYPAPVRLLYREIYRRTKARPLRAADRLVTVSRWGGAFLRGPLGLPQVGEVTNGADPTRFRPAHPGEREALRSEYGFTRFTVLIPGRFAPEKNQLTALLAARHAPDLDFVFVGDQDAGLGAAAHRLQKLLRLRNVRFLGRRWDMPGLYRAADVLLQPTLAENQSLVTLEAMSSALPIVTTPIPAQAELVKDGHTGLLVPAQPRLLATALRALAAHPDRARQLGLNARQFVLDHHTIHHTAALVAAVLHGTLPERRSRA